MTGEQLARLMGEIDSFCEREQIGFDDFLEGMADDFRRQAAGADELIGGLYLSIAESLQQAALDFYVSTK